MNMNDASNVEPSNKTLLILKFLCLRSDSGCYECEGEECQCYNEDDQQVNDEAVAEAGDTEMVTIVSGETSNNRDVRQCETVLRERSHAVTISCLCHPCFVIVK